MKLRIKLSLLAVGAILVPALVTAFAGALSYRYTEKRKPLTPRRIDKIAEHFENELAAQLSDGVKGEPLKAPQEIPENVRILVIDTRNNILYSNFPHVSYGESISNQLPSFDFETGSLERLMLSIPLVVEDIVSGALVIRFTPRPLQDKKGPPVPVRILERGAFGIGAFVIFAVIMVIIIMKSINRSIRGLDEATSRVAEGDLNFELKPQGNDEFTSLTKSFELMRKELKDNQEQRSRFLMGVSHDLKTPLTSIEGYLEAIDDGIADNPDKLQKYISIIKNKSKVLEERIVQLIDFVKMERGEWELQKNEINLGEYLKNLAINYTEDIPVFKRMFHFKIDLPNEYKVYADVPLLTRAFENLIANAIQYTREEDTIILEARKSEAGVVIILKDSGPGIPEQEKEKIFEPFYRGTSSRREQGTGLGLSVVKSIFNSHGWRIEVKSTLNQGTEFVISIREKDV